MRAGEIIYWFILIPIIDFRRRWLPSKCAIPGKTRVQYVYSMPTSKTVREGCKIQDEVLEGTIISCGYEYVGHDDELSRPAGTYIDGNRRFPNYFIIRPDDGGELVFVHSENVEFISDYEYAICALHEVDGENARIGPLPVRLKCQSGDTIRLVDDEDYEERVVGRVIFTPLGNPEYEIFLSISEQDTVREIEEAKKAIAYKRGECYSVFVDDHPGTHSWVRGEDIASVVQRAT